MFGRNKTIAKIPMHGVIADGPDGINIGRFAPLIEKAFNLRNIAAVWLDLDSPGGSPAHSAEIADLIRAYADSTGIPVVATIKEVAASGGCWISCAADEIIANPTSIVGSIGVVSASFGFHKLIDAVGIERRVKTAGQSKVSSDPFLPEDPAKTDKDMAVMTAIHEEFINWVKSRRGDKLKLDTPGLFEGQIWLGRQGLEIGLVDMLKASSVYEAELESAGYTIKLLEPKAARRGGIVSRMLSSSVESAVHSVADRMTHELKKAALNSHIGLS